VKVPELQWRMTLSLVLNLRTTVSYMKLVLITKTRRAARSKRKVVNADKIGNKCAAEEGSSHKKNFMISMLMSIRPQYLVKTTKTIDPTYYHLS
jgi:hypothetical protein